MGLKADVYFGLYVGGPITLGPVSGWAYKRQFAVSV